MQKAQRDSIRSLYIILGAAIAVPAILFIYSSWLGYQTTQAVAARQIERTRDILTEHALKVFESVQRATAEINEMLQDFSDEQIINDQDRLHFRLKRLTDGAPEIKSLWVFGRDGRTLLNSLTLTPPQIDFTDRDYFKAHVEQNVGTFVGEILYPRRPYDGAPFFGVSRRRTTTRSNFDGVIQASILPNYFEGFYAKIAEEAGSYAALVRSDGRLLVRFPTLKVTGPSTTNPGLLKEMQAGVETGSKTILSSIDKVERKVAFRKLTGFPIYVVAGLESPSIRAVWLSQMRSQLLFGLPATAALIAIILLAIKRTHGLHEEAKRRQDAELGLRHAQRLEALGRLTGGVAHDFNNLLMVVAGSAERLKREQANERSTKAIQMIESAVAKGESLTRQLLSFSKRQALSPKVINLSSHIRSCHDLLRQSLGSGVQLTIVLPPQSVLVKIDPNEFEIALLNLVVNARDAMPDGGQITISMRSERRRLDPASAAVTPCAVVNISDTGTGIPEDIRHRVFEPFFTTKEVDRGTGLGLSQVYGFLQQSGGTIEIMDAARGTTFQLVLPCTDDVLETPAVSERVQSHSSSVLVLLVEDNEDVAVVATDYVEQCGYDVIHARSAEDALELLGSRRDVGLIFSDIVMPGISGIEMAHIIRKRYSAIPIVLASGYSDRTTSAKDDGFTILQKPYSLDALRTALSDALT